MYSDVIFGWVLWIWLIVNTFFWYFDFFWQSVEIFPRGTGGNGGPAHHPANFKIRLASDHETKSKYSEKNANYSAKSTIFSQKQRLYTYDRGVYAPTLYHYRFKSHYKQMDPAIVLDHKCATLEFFVKNTTCYRHQFQKFQKNTQICYGILL